MERPSFENPIQVIQYARDKNQSRLHLGYWDMEFVPEEIKDFEQLEFLDLRYNQITQLPEWIEAKFNLHPDYNSDDYGFGKVLMKGNPFAKDNPTEPLNLNETVSPAP